MRGQIFLDLQATRENIDDPRHLRKPDDFAVWNICDVRAADEREEMMFAERVKFDVFDQDDLARLRIEDRIVNDLFDALAIALGEKFHRARGTRGRAREALSLGVFADCFE